jgi:hypothetical protein
VGCGGMDWVGWLRIETDGGHLWMWYERSGSTNCGDFLDYLETG